MLMQTTTRVSSRQSSNRIARREPLSTTVSTSVSLGGTIEMMGAPMPFARNAEIYGENEPAEYLYKVMSGAVRTYKVLNDGRRQIGSFYLPGDVFGLEVGDLHSFSAEAVADTKVLIIKRSALVTLASRDTEVARQLWTMATRELQRAQDHIMLLIKTAQERVAGFLLEMAERNAGAHGSRAANVAPRHRRLSRSDNRNRVAHADATGKFRCYCGADLPPHRVA